jgi:hypothetical protein
MWQLKKITVQKNLEVTGCRKSPYPWTTASCKQWLKEAVQAVEGAKLLQGPLRPDNDVNVMQHIRLWYSTSSNF